MPLAGDWRQARPAQRFGYVVGGTLVLVGLAHLAAWLGARRRLAGANLVPQADHLGISFGLLLGPLAAADTYEVAWVAVQRWRGVASHFNFATPLDTRLFLAGVAAIAVTVTVIVALTVLSFTRLRAAPSMAVAVRAGLLILLVAQGVGGWMIGHGVGPASDGVTQGLTTFGAPNRDYREEPTSKAGCWGICG